MVRMTDLAASAQANLNALDCPELGAPAWVPPIDAAKLKVALISSAGIMQRGRANIAGNAPGYEEIHDSVDDGALLLNHVSVNFDRTGFARDVNVVLPRARLRELVEEGVIGAASETHYAFMGATHPDAMAPYVDQLAQELRANGVNAACLLPV